MTTYSLRQSDWVSVGEQGADVGRALRILTRLFRGFETPPILRFWDNTVVAPARSDAIFTLIFNDPSVLRRLVTERSPLLLADAYFSGALDVQGDLYGALRLKDHFSSLVLSWREKLALLRDAWSLPESRPDLVVNKASVLSRWAQRFTHRHSRESDKAAISFHYDVSNDFYKLWLDKERIYSCAVFQSAAETLEQAQINKLDLICRKLRLQAGERLLDIGCGWGALVCWAARNYGVYAHGITLSQNQFEFVQQRIVDEGLEEYVTVELRDYRDLPLSSVYDKVSSIGMFEHVGLRNLSSYVQAVYRILKPGGLFLNHGITHDEVGWNKTVETEFINRYVFPDGELDCISNIQLGMESAGFEIHDVEGLRLHYALTLRQWVKRLEEKSYEAQQMVGEQTYRVWRLYMAACALEFESGGTGVYQILASRRDKGHYPVPMSRADLYE
ncbi:MAG: cyclopropane-fatty-acyl-phospholipid synthase family protein [Pseudomonadota bacterium]